MQAVNAAVLNVVAHLDEDGPLYKNHNNMMEAVIPITEVLHSLKEKACYL